MIRDASIEKKNRFTSFFSFLSYASAFLASRRTGFEKLML